MMSLRKSEDDRVGAFTSRISNQVSHWVLNLMKWAMQVGGKQQSIECFGWKMLPGVCCANKAMDFEIHFKVQACLQCLDSSARPTLYLDVCSKGVCCCIFGPACRILTCCWPQSLQCKHPGQAPIKRIAQRQTNCLKHHLHYKKVLQPEFCLARPQLVGSSHAEVLLEDDARWWVMGWKTAFREFRDS